MRKRWAVRPMVGAMVGIGAAICMLASAWASERNSGDWSMRRSDAPESVQLSLQSDDGAHRFHTTSDWKKSEFSGLDLSRSGKQDARFSLTRDAGKFEFDGVLRDGVGAGAFRFLPDAKYVQEMKALGFGGVADEQMAFAIHDVSLSFARDMKKENLQGLDSEKLVAFRIHGVTPELVRHVRAAGYTAKSDDLIAMRIHGATPEWMDGFKQRGYERVSLDDLVAFRIHDVSPALIDELGKLGYQHPEPEQLVTMRIHGVTPEYIGELQARGLKNLTIEKLVAMKIHGID